NWGQTRSGRFQSFQRVAAALAVLVPALVLIVLATRDPRSGVSQVATTQPPSTQPARNGEIDEAAPEALDLYGAVADKTTKFKSNLEREEARRLSSSGRKLDSLADAPVREDNTHASGKADSAHKPADNHYYSKGGLGDNRAAESGRGASSPAVNRDVV